MKRRTNGSGWGLLVIAAVVALTHGGIALADIHSGLEVRYRLDETSGDANDSSTNTGRNGTLQGNATFNTAGRVGGCVNLDGDGDYVKCPKITQTDGASQLTIAFWLNTDLQTDNDAIVGKVEDGNNLFIIHLAASGAGGSNDIAVAIHKDATNSYIYTDSNVVPNGVWVHVAIVYNGALSGSERCKVYVKRSGCNDTWARCISDRAP
jgi:hypothetical protein